MSDDKEKNTEKENFGGGGGGGGEDEKCDSTRSARVRFDETTNGRNVVAAVDAMEQGSSSQEALQQVGKQQETCVRGGAAEAETTSSSRPVIPAGAASLMGLFSPPPPPPPLVAPAAAVAAPPSRKGSYVAPVRSRSASIGLSGIYSSPRRAHDADFAADADADATADTAATVDPDTPTGRTATSPAGPSTLSSASSLTIENKNNVLPGAASLMGLFSPPPNATPAISNRRVVVEQRHSQDKTQQEGARHENDQNDENQLFFTEEKPTKQFAPFERPAFDRRKTMKQGNRQRQRGSSADSDDLAFFNTSPVHDFRKQPSPASAATTSSSLSERNEQTPLLSHDDAMMYQQNSTKINNHATFVPLNDLFQPPDTKHPTTVITNDDRESGHGHRYDDDYTKEHDDYDPIQHGHYFSRFLYAMGSFKHKSQSWCNQNVTRDHISSFFIGSFTFLLYHIVFCLAQASAITRPHSRIPILGPMAKTAALGIIFSGPLFIMSLGNDAPALYPCTDLFLAPFMANLAYIVDETLYQQQQHQEENANLDDDNEQVFLASFTVLAGIGLALSGVLCVLASTFKLANLGVFLPYPVLCGFFTAVGIMMWKLAFAVDTGLKVGMVLTSGDSTLIISSIVHHLPSLVVGILMKIFGPKKPYYVTFILVCTVTVFYLVMFLTGTTIEEAREMKWFWTEDQLVSENKGDHVGFKHWSPPAPFGVLHAMFDGKVNWTAVANGLSTAVALAFLYLLRCSLHAAALKKNIPNLIRKEPKEKSLPLSPTLRSSSGRNGVTSPGSALSSRGMQMRDDSFRFTSDTSETSQNSESKAEGKKSQVTMLKILKWYGNSQILGSLVGGFGCVPTIAVASTLFNLGAEGTAPQYGSIGLLVIFYLTEFRLVTYVPKPAFSCLLVLAFLDITVTWCIKSFKKTKHKSEWVVVPLIVVSAFVLGMLASVALGIALSTFIFVGAFYRTGVVKYLASGLTIRSTVERSLDSSDWLDMNGDLIQILVLQNYLFFGNASSCLNYITSMFEEPSPSEVKNLDFPLPPVPKYLILDLTLVTGMDTSAVDVFAEIITLCKAHQCSVFIAGASQNLKSILSHGGVSGAEQKNLRFFSNMEAALGKAEDNLLVFVRRVREEDARLAGIRRRSRLMSEDDDGFPYALRQIDDQHGLDFASKLAGLQKYTTPIELTPGQTIFEDEGGCVGDSERGLFFIEHGLMKVERDPSYTLTRSSLSSLKRNGGVAPSGRGFEGGSIGHLKARTATIGRESAFIKGASFRDRTSQNFRLARFGPGWVVGSIEGFTGLRNPGIHEAVTSCRLHHLPFEKMKEIEKENPTLILNLLKLIAHLMARRQEVTIEQLATLHSIMTSPAPTKPISRATMAAISNAMKYY